MISLRSAFLCLSAFLACIAHAAPDVPLNPTSIAESRNQLIKLTDEGLEPPALRMNLEDSIVFLLNATSESLATIEIDFNGKLTHCATKNLKIKKNKHLHSIRPYGPGDFASFCFHERGTYPFVVYGVKANQGIQGSIIVE